MISPGLINVLTVILLTAGYIDLKYRKIPPFIILLLFIYAVLFSPLLAYEKVFGVILTALPLYLIAMLTDKIKGGDVKFIIMLGMALGIVKLAWALVFATICALIYSAVKKEKSVPLAFCTFVGYISANLIWGLM